MIKEIRMFSLVLSIGVGMLILSLLVTSAQYAETRLVIFVSDNKPHTEAKEIDMFYVATYPVASNLSWKQAHNLLLQVKASPVYDTTYFFLDKNHNDTWTVLAMDRSMLDLFGKSPSPIRFLIPADKDLPEPNFQTETMSPDLRMWGEMDDGDDLQRLPPYRLPKR